MILGSEHLSTICFVIGVVFAVISYLITARPDAVAGWMQGFPRNRAWGIILTAAGLLWSAIMIDQMTLGEIGKYKWLLYILTPLSFYLIIQYLDELLAPRALGGLLMLLPTVLVDAERWHHSNWRLVVAVVAYAMVIVGIWLMLCPFKFRIWTTCMMAGKRNRMASSALFTSVAVLLFLAGKFTR